MIKVEFMNCAACELAVRTVEDENQINEAVLDLLRLCDLAEGDKIVVGWAEDGH